MNHLLFHRLKVFALLACAIGALPLTSLAKPPAAKLVLLPTSVNRNDGSSNNATEKRTLGDATMMLAVLIDEKTVGTNSGPTHLGLVRSLKQDQQSDVWRDLRFAKFLGAANSGASAATADYRNQVGYQVPEIIRLQSPQVIRAWTEVQQAIAENEKLSDPLPEPYFARGEILTISGDFDSALRDYLHAVEIASKSRANLAAYSAYFERLLEALDNYDKVPRPPALGRSMPHFSTGMQSYYEGNMDAAQRHFTNAISLDNNIALYWYFRALTFKRLGDDRRAKHDALIGAHLESRYDESERVGQGLTRVQGDLRLWLERYRLGDPTQQLLK